MLHLAAVNAIAAGLVLPPQLKLLALDIRRGGLDEVYHVEFDGNPGRLRPLKGDEWSLSVAGEQNADQVLRLGEPEDVFAAALGGGSSPSQRRSRDECFEELIRAAPHWNSATGGTPILRNLARRGISGEGTIAFDGATFLALLQSASPVERPLLLPQATRVLADELGRLERAASLLSAFATTLRAGRVDVSSNAFAETFIRADRAERAVNAIRAWQRETDGAPPLGETEAAEAAEEQEAPWDGAGRLIGEWPDGDLAQVGRDVKHGCELAVGKGLHTATFAPSEPLGIGFGPLSLRDGIGCQVGEVDPGSAAERLGVTAGMVVHQITRPDVVGLAGRPFDEVLGLIDARRDAGDDLTVVFDTAAPVGHLYAVEMPSVAALRAIAISEARTEDDWCAADADASAALQRALRGQAEPAQGQGRGQGAAPPPPGCILWHEAETKAFVGDAGSMTCAHVDIAPQLELAHGLHGVKFVGVGTYEATPRLLREHAAAALDDEEEDDEDDDEDDGNEEGAERAEQEEEEEEEEERSGRRRRACRPTDPWRRTRPRFWATAPCRSPASAPVIFSSSRRRACTLRATAPTASTRRSTTAS